MTDLNFPDREALGVEVLGVVAFARNEVDKWVVSMLRLDQRAEDVTYQLNRPVNVV